MSLSAGARIGSYEISPDDSRMAVVVGASGSGDIWIRDFRRVTFTRLTFDNVNASPPTTLRLVLNGIER